MKANIGDTIQWDFKDERYKKYYPTLYGKVFEAKVLMIDDKDKHYGVLSIYGEDYIPFNECKIIKNNF